MCALAPGLPSSRGPRCPVRGEWPRTPQKPRKCCLLFVSRPRGLSRNGLQTGTLGRARGCLRGVVTAQLRGQRARTQSRLCRPAAPHHPYLTLWASWMWGQEVSRSLPQPLPPCPSSLPGPQLLSPPPPAPPRGLCPCCLFPGACGKWIEVSSLGKFCS